MTRDSAFRRPPYAEVVEAGGRQAIALGCLAGVLAWMLAQVGFKYAFAGVVAIALIGALALVRERERLMLVVACLSLAALMHKSFSTIHDVSSGPPSLYISTLDVAILLLYLFWFTSGSLSMEFSATVRRPAVWLPLVGVLCTLPSLLVTSSVALSLAEIQRMVMAWLLYVYVAARVRRRSDVWLVLSALTTIVVVEFVIVLGQWATNSPLGLSFLGTPQTLNQRITNTESIGRPFGTIEHPDFLAAVLGPIALVALCLAIRHTNRRVKIGSLVVAALASAPMVISHTRSAALGLAVATIGVIVVSLATRRLRVRVFLGWLVAIAVLAGVFSGQLLSLYHTDFHTTHFSLEVQARDQLYAIGWKIFGAHPLLGTGLNNFQQIMDQYNSTGLIFDGNPVHNLFLLQAAETGIVGFAAIALAGAPVLVNAIRLSRSGDRLYSAVGMGVVAMIAFFVVEEMFIFSLRQEPPRSLFWLLAGLTLACVRLQDLPEGQPAPPTRPWLSRRRSGGRPVRTAHPRPRPALPAPPRRRLGLGGVAMVVRGVASRTSQLPRRLAATAAATGRALIRRARVLPRPHLGKATTAAATAASLLLTLGGFVIYSPASHAAPLGELLFTAQDRSPDSPGTLLPASGIYAIDPDGSDLHQIIGHDGLDFSWAKWALNGTRIVFAAHEFAKAGAPNQLFLANADGTHIQQLTSTTWTSGQPTVSSDGRYVIFTSTWPEFPKFAIYRLDLRTLLVTNLSAATSTYGSADADPRFGPHGARIYYSRSTFGHRTVKPTQIWSMSTTGHSLEPVTHDRYWNTDPAVSRDGKYVAYSSYRGPGRDSQGDPAAMHVKPHDWFIVVRTLSTGHSIVVNEGKWCSKRAASRPCALNQGSGFVPVWSPDSDAVAFSEPISDSTTCICAANADGSSLHPIATTTMKIQYLDWAQQGQPPATAARVGSQVSPSRLLFLGSGSTSHATQLYEARPDRWGSTQLKLLPRLFTDMTDARWSRNRQSFVFTAQKPPSKVPSPRPAPKGHHRIRHYTLGWLANLILPHPDRSHVDLTQTFLGNATTGVVKEVTTGSTEDWHDAIPDGEWRGNSQPDLSPSGRYLVVTNLSSTTAESFLLRIDLKTHRVFNLTNATAGAVPTTDFDPRFSPDGGSIAFATMRDGSAQIATIDSRTGRHFHALTDDKYFNIAPTWSPDGRYIVYASYRGHGPVSSDPRRDGHRLIPGHLSTRGWYLVRVDTRTGAKKVLTSAGDSPTLSPVFSPDGKQIAYIGDERSPRQPDIFIMPSAGGPPSPLQVTLRTQELSLDWR